MDTPNQPLAGANNGKFSKKRTSSYDFVHRHPGKAVRSGVSFGASVGSELLSSVLAFGCIDTAANIFGFRTHDEIGAGRSGGDFDH